MTLALKSLVFFAACFIANAAHAQIPSTVGWHSLTNTQLSAVCPNPATFPGIQGSTGCSSVTSAWSGGAYDSVNNRLIITGGGHADYAGNEVYALSLSGTPTMQRLNDPSTPVRDGCVNNGEYADGKPVSRHWYNHLEYLPDQNELFGWGGSQWFCGNGSSQTWVFNLTTLAWTRITAGNTPASGFYRAVAYDPANKLIYAHDDFNLKSFNRLTNTWTTRSSAGPGWNSKTAVIDTTRRRYYMMSIDSTTLWWYDITAATGNLTLQSGATTGCSGVVNNDRTGWAYDPVQDRLVGWLGGNTVYLLNVDTLTCTTVVHTGGPTAEPNGTFGRFRYVPALNVFIVCNLWNSNCSALRLTAGVAVGTLAHDGPATPEQLSLALPVTGTVAQGTTATVRYKTAGALTWTTAHPLYRVRPTFSTSPAVGSVTDVFAWPIIDLAQGTTYNVEVVLAEGTNRDGRLASFTTRSLPATAAAANKTITAGSSSATIQAAFNGLNPGDVLEFQNGTYNVSGLQLSRSGTLNSPIYIRGASRNGVVLANGGLILQILAANHVIIENMTLQGSGIDSGTNASSKGIEFFDGTPNQTRITVRNVTMTGVDKGIAAYKEISEFLAYDNILTGNNTWSSALIDTNATWNDDGINIPGFGNCAFNNTITGFGDSLSYAAHSGGGTLTQSIGVHFYRNDVRNSGDDFAELDHSHRNITLYDNRSHNSMTFLSLDPLYGGPALIARNIAINVGRSPFKWNDTNTGQFVYNNTIVRTTGQDWVQGAFTAEAGWYQPNNGAQRSYGYRNNLLVYRGSGTQTIRLDNTGHDVVDFTHNSWFPNATWQWPTHTSGSLAGIYAALSLSTPIFSGQTRRHEQDNITVSNPWTATVTLGANYLTEVTSVYTPVISGGDAAKNSGAVIPNITDGFSGAAPDRGAVIAGRSLVSFGAGSGSPPIPPSSLRTGQITTSGRVTIQ